MRRNALIALATVLGLLLLAGPALGQSLFQRVFQDFRGDQRIRACSWTPDQLRRARSQTPPDIEQYAPNFLDEVNRAIEAHARGQCKRRPPKPKPEPEPEPEPEPDLIDPGPTPAPPPASTADPSLTAAGPPSLVPDRGMPLALSLLMGAVILLLAGGGGYGLLRMRDRLDR